RDAVGDHVDPPLFTAMPSPAQPVVPQQPHGRYLATLALAALGVVYGDIVTSPLYAIRYSFSGTHGIPVTPGNVLGVLSLVFWSLVIVVTIKYHIVIIRADNKGEGGVLALMALVNGSRVARGLSPRRVMIVLGIFGSALLYADGGLTPAISVLSAVEGLEIAMTALGSRVIAVTLVMLIGVFLVVMMRTDRLVARVRGRGPHAGDLGAERRRRARDRDAGAGLVGDPRDPRDPDRSVPGAKSRDRPDRGGARPRDARLVRHDRRAWSEPDHSATLGAGGGLAVPRGALFRRRCASRIRGAGRRVSRRHRWRGALRRPGSLWPSRDSNRVVRCRAPLP